MARSGLAATRPFIVERAISALPQTTATAFYTVTGTVLVTVLEAKVTTIVQAQANATKWISNPTVGADVDMCATNDINADAVGTVWSMTGTLADAMVATTSGVHLAQATPFIVEAGTIDLSCAASNTGNVSAVLQYFPITSNSSVVTA